MNLPRVLELMMTFLEDAISRKKKEEPNNIDWFIEKHFFKVLCKSKDFL